MAAFSATKKKLLTTKTQSNYPFLRKSLSLFQSSASPYTRSYSSRSSTTFQEREKVGEDKEEEDVIPTSGLGRPLSEIIKELNKKVPDSLVRQRVEDGFTARYVPWYLFLSLCATQIHSLEHTLKYAFHIGIA
uniref:Uncharacterized protein LOC105111291 n=1 Tax=Rhizophora mucronata TaxID=61149 RepID=A0A2P2IQJ5_RHIMU